MNEADSRLTSPWLLPEGITEILPSQARRLEFIRRKVLDMYETWGYQLVITPMLEYLESLQIGTGQDLDLQTFKLIDTLSGRLLGVRADITPQAARIDARQTGQDAPVRLCYLGTVLRAYQDAIGGTRAPLQLGAELYGHAGIESDIEIIDLMLETFRIVGVEKFVLDLGHVAIFRGLVEEAGLDPQQEQQLFDALQRKAIPEINQLLNQWSIPNRVHTMLSSLANLNGGQETLSQARGLLSAAPSDVIQALDQLGRVAKKIRDNRPEVEVHFDLSELRGYQYQTGIVFAAFIPGYGQEVARGGRYDNIGETFGRSRPATGFSADLKVMLDYSEDGTRPSAKKPIFAPYVEDESLQDMILALRNMGEQVISELPGQAGDAESMGCDRILVKFEDEWDIKQLKKNKR